MTFGEKIRYHRERIGISQDDMAEKIGVSKSSLSRYETDEREPSFITAICIADVLGVSLDYLAGKAKE